MKVELTEAQVAAVEKAFEVLKEHFDSALLVVDTEAAEGTDRVFNVGWHGGITAGIGLAERAKMRLRRAIEEDEETEGDEG